MNTSVSDFECCFSYLDHLHSYDIKMKYMDFIFKFKKINFEFIFKYVLFLEHVAGEIVKYLRSSLMYVQKKIK
jgi:hypothetical protein